MIVRSLGPEDDPRKIQSPTKSKADDACHHLGLPRVAILARTLSFIIGNPLRLLAESVPDKGMSQVTSGSLRSPRFDVNK